MSTKKWMCYKVKNKKYVLLYAGRKRGLIHYDILDSNGQEIASSLPYEQAIEYCQLDRVYKTKFARRRDKKRKPKIKNRKAASRLKYSGDALSIAEFLEYTSEEDIMLCKTLTFDFEY